MKYQTEMKYFVCQVNEISKNKILWYNWIIYKKFDEILYKNLIDFKRILIKIMIRI